MDQIRLKLLGLMGLQRRRALEQCRLHGNQIKMQCVAENRAEMVDYMCSKQISFTAHAATLDLLITCNLGKLLAKSGGTF